VAMAANLAERGLKGDRSAIVWTPLWGMLGIGLPITFAGQVRSASMYLQSAELIPLYATEWIIIAAIGIVISVTSIGLNVIARRLWPQLPSRVGSTAAFAMTIAFATLVASQIWITSLGLSSRSQNGWHALTLALVLAAGIGAGCGACRQALTRLATLARTVACLGALSLLSMTFIRSVSHTVHKAISQMPNHPNIVLISVDALAARHLIPYGATRATSPNIAKFASESIIFERFHANGNFTTPGVASILTGLLPWKHRALQLLGTPSVASIEDSLPARMHNAGYLTAYFATNPWAGARRLGFSEYFDYQSSIPDWDSAPCVDSIADRLPYLCGASSNPLIVIPFKLAARAADGFGLLDLDKFYDPKEAVSAASRWMKDRGDAPVFMWVHFMPPHDPYSAPSPWINKFDPSAIATTPRTSHPQYLFDSAFDSANRIRILNARYDESISYVDHYIGQLISLVRENLGPNTAILLTADHGESFSHNYGGHGGVMLYEDLLHIPLILSPPGSLAHEIRRPELTNQIDLAPTIAAIAQVAPSQSWDGVSLIEQSNKANDRAIFAMSFEQNQSRSRLANGAVAVLQSSWKLVRFLGASRYPNMPSLETQLFNIANDPLEEHNIAAAHPDVVGTLSAQIDEQLAVAGGAAGE
jgi:arylsulfatase A-like enzyme